MNEVSAARKVAAAPNEPFAPGTCIGKYEIVHRIAFGGMAEIYLARAGGIHGFEKYVVLKRILPQYAANEEFVRMFLNEARVAATLDHANVAHVYDIGETAGSYFFTMEYLHGEDLRWIMHELGPLGPRMPLEHALEIAIGVASGLHFAHEKRGPDGRPLGIVHRDISPPS
jgi:eukaryotic-like serine/threonine-protein kinase